MRKRKLEVTKGVKAAMITQPRHYLEAQGQLRPANGGAAAALSPAWPLVLERSEPLLYGIKLHFIQWIFRSYP